MRNLHDIGRSLVSDDMKWVAIWFMRKYPSYKLRWSPKTPEYFQYSAPSATTWMKEYINSFSAVGKREYPNDVFVPFTVEIV